MSAASIRAGRAFVELQLRKNAFLKGIKSVQRTFSKRMAEIQRSGLALTGIGLTGLGGFTLAVKQASDLNEAVNKTQSVFGPAARAIETFAKTSADKFGISKRAANSYASELGLILTKTGSTRAEAARMSIDLVKLGADMASMNNIGLDEALTKIKAGLVGSSEPLRSVGVLLSAASVEARAAEMGLEKVNGKFTEGAKVAARYALIIEQTKETAGDFSRTSGSLANVTRRITASMENAAASIGSAVLPAYRALAGIIASVAGWLAKFAESNKVLTQVLFGLVLAIAATGTALLGLSTTGSVALAVLGAIGVAVEILLSPMILVGAAIGIFVAQMTALVALPIAGFFAVWLTQSEAAKRLMVSLANALGKLLAVGRDTFSGIMAAISNGNWSLAAQITMAGLNAGFLTGMEIIKNNWKVWLVTLAQSLRQTFDAVRRYASKVLAFLANKLIGVSVAAGKISKGDLQGAVAQVAATAAATFNARINLDEMLFGDIDARAKAARAELKRLVDLAGKAKNTAAVTVSNSLSATKAKSSVDSLGFDEADIVALATKFGSLFASPKKLAAIDQQRQRFVDVAGGSSSTFVGAAASQMGLIGELRKSEKKQFAKLEKLQHKNNDILANISNVIQMMTGWDIGSAN